MSDSPLSDFNNEELIHYSLTLLSQASGRLEMEDVQGACWRLANALGALSLICAEKTPGVTEQTHLGYKLEATNDHPRQIPPTQ